MTKASQTALENLRLAIHGVTSPFFCEGTFVPDKPVTLVFKDQTRFEVTRASSPFNQTKDLTPLLNHCAPAPFGAGKKTRFDPRVRDAYQLKAENGGFRIENFDLESAGILKKIQRELVPHEPHAIQAELYTLNVYPQGGHFAPHKDTPRGGDMFGTLVVCLPSQFSSGKFVLRHRGVVQKFDWGAAIAKQQEPSQLHWAAFFSDVDHQIEEIWSGARVTLTWLLRRTPGGAPLREAGGEDLAPVVQEAWRALLAEPSFLPKGGTLAYPCCHLYHQDARFQQVPLAISDKSGPMLKGRDCLAAAGALDAGLNVTFNPYMFENCADGTWQLNRFPTPQEKSRLRSRMDDEKLSRVLPIRAGSEDEGDFGVTWLEPRPTTDRLSWRSDENDDTQLPAAAHLHSCEYCPWGYFGNEGSDVDLYTYAALHFEIPPFGEGVRVASEPAKRKPVKKKAVQKKQVESKPAKGKRSGRNRKSDQD